VAFLIGTADGLEQLTLQRLASKLGTSPSALYRYFRNKEALLSAMGDEAAQLGLDALSQNTTTAISISSDIRERALQNVIQLFQAWRLFQYEQPVAYKLLIPTVYASKLSTKTDSLLSLFDQAFEKTVTVAALRPEPARQRTITLIASLNGILPLGDPYTELALLHTLLCGWGAPRSMVERLTENYGEALSSSLT
jgi:AcrR family transcriptional regulator